MSMRTDFACSRSVTVEVEEPPAENGALFRWAAVKMQAIADCRPGAPRPIDTTMPVALFREGEEASWYACARAVFNDIGNELLAFVRQEDVDAMREKLVERRRAVFNDDGSLK